ncbi:FUSC family protein [Bradyrhizobium valentinum]|uniref:Fusaric acid resistance protein n=1 Tax=Bradyrhizobium valentinum TaxID=1518501 RepID=A0A0R3KYT3_9BRAD|nr:FUSC family protein [Bradyrhizobium valentinum]KRQ98101.1 hypothetical protein CP49_30180 [Bradyrhizobium valentinum]
MNQRSSFLVRHAALIFALKTFAAAMLAYSIAVRLDTPRPFWAMASVFITSSPLTGATSSKAVYRILGTLIGGAGTIVLLPNLVNSPELLSLGIALWLGIFLYFALIDGTPRSYVFMLAGYTVALLAFPIVSTPELTFDIVVSRVQEITLGIICASVVSMLVLPQSVASAIAAQADSWLAAARRLGADVLTGSGSEHERDKERMRLAAAASQIDELSAHLGYETAASANAVRGLQLLRQHMLSLLPLLASIEDQKAALSAHGGMPAGTAEICARVARWLGEGSADSQEADLLSAALAEVQPVTTDGGWTEIMAAGLVTQLRHVIGTVQDCLTLRKAIADGRDPEQFPLAFTRDTSGVTISHRDHGLALWSAGAAALSVLACCAFWIATGWVDGASAALFAAVIGAFLASVDDPVPAYRDSCMLVLICVVITGIYTFGVLPRITTIEMLVAVLMPVFVLFGWMAARPATARVGTLLGIFTSVQLALQPSYSASFDSFANSNIALVLGVALAGVVCGIVRFFGTGWIANRLLRSNWTTLVAVAGNGARQDRVAVSSLMQHRLALLAARAAAVPAEARSDAANLRQLRAALSIIDVRQASFGLSRLARASIEALLARLASVSRVNMAGRLPVELLAQLDETIAFTLQEPAAKARDEALVGLTGIRFGLFREAPAYQTHEPEQGRMAA